MKRILGLAAIALIALSVLTVTSCELIKDTASAKDTMEGFIADANNENYDALKQYLHSSAGQYDQSNDGFWDTRLTTYLDLSLDTIAGNTATVSGSGVTFTFTLEDDGGDMKIRTITRSGSIIFN